MPKLGISIIIAVALVFLAASQGALDWASNGLSSLRFAVAKRAPTGAIGLVEIDAKSLQAIGTWPWSRAIHAKIVDRLVESGASEIAFDIDFSARSTEAADAIFEEALERAGGGVILAAFNQTYSAQDLGKIHANRPLQRFADQGWEGIVNVFADGDGSVRKFSYGQKLDDEIVPSIPALLGGFSGSETSEFYIDFGINAFLIERISAIDLIEGRVSPDIIKDRKFIVGAGAAELRDTFAVPHYGIISGPMVQVVAAETILQSRALQKTGVMLGGAGLLGLALLVLLALRWLRSSRVVIALAATSFALEGTAILVQSKYPVIFDTSQMQAGLSVFAVLILVRELDYRKLKLYMSRRNVLNVRTILDQVVADNFDGIVIVDEQLQVTSCSRVAYEILGQGQNDNDVEDPGRKERGGDQEDVDGLGESEAKTSFEIELDDLPVEMSAVVARTLWNARKDSLLEASPVAECKFTINGQPTPQILEYVVTPSQLQSVSETNKVGEAKYVACLTFRDITEKRAVEDRLAYLAKTDKLTGLANRNHFCEQLKEAIEASARLRAAPSSVGQTKADEEGKTGVGSVAQGGAVICFNLNRFRNVNDTLGHETGDRLLQTVARRVDLLLDETDVLARFGGDEYAVLVFGPTSQDDAIKKTNLIIEAIAAPMRLGRHDIVPSANAGIAMIGGPDDGVEQILRDADAALLKVKSDGHEKYRLFDPQMGAKIRARREIEMDLWGGLDRGEFEVFYQPQVLLGSAEINGVEALVRWNHPQRGFVSPADFIPIAETTGMIEKLGAHVLEEACREVASWPKPLKVAVNLSAVQFQRGNLVETVAHALDVTGLPAKQLDLEITESLFLGGGGNIESILDNLLGLGLTFSLDDFGTGYSSLSYIHKFPIHKIKIDQAFVRNLHEDQASLAIVRAVSTLADALGLITTVEGIETNEQAKLVHLAGCTQGQGYYFGKPQRGAEIRALLSASSKAPSKICLP